MQECEELYEASIAVWKWMNQRRAVAALNSTVVPPVDVMTRFYEVIETFKATKDQ
jgi:hypothetical protein